MHRLFWNEGFRVFGLHSFKGKVCACGRADCEAAGKHPLSSSWQHTPIWDEGQIDLMEESGQFASGFGVLCRGLLVIDVDARNGGIESFTKLSEAVPEIAQAGLIVGTGSGGGSKHLYFRAPPEGVALVQHLNEYPGLDFKSSGFVVGPGSRHRSGKRYSILYGEPSDIGNPPEGLVDLLKRQDRHRADYDGSPIDVSHDDLVDMLAFIPNDDLDYEDWIRIGMAVHHATGGAGFAIWSDWSATSKKHNQENMKFKWDSFGRAANPVTLGTLVHHASKTGWLWPVTFGEELTEPDTAAEKHLPFDISGVDLTAPPGFVGELTLWIESRNRRPRKNLSVATALSVVGNIGGLRYTDDRDGVTTNLLVFGVAGARTGKEGLQQSMTAIMVDTGLSAASHGSIKSEQEIIRNLIEHQANFYMIDEWGYFLKKLKNAETRGGASYLENVISVVMSAYGKANGYMLLTGDAKREVIKFLVGELSNIHKKMTEKGESPALKADEATMSRRISDAEKGLYQPFLSLIGFTTPETFEDLVDFQSATSGFIGRSLIFNERNTVPAHKENFRSGAALPDDISMTLCQIYNGGSYDVMAYKKRIEADGDRRPVPTDPAALDMLDGVLAWLEREAVAQKADTGLEALYLGAYELVSKVSLILALPEGRRTVEDVRYAFALVKRDVEDKSRLVMSNDLERVRPVAALEHRIMNIVAGEDGETIGVIHNRLERKFKRPDIDRALENMVASGKILRQDIPKAFRRKATTIYKMA